MPKCEIKTGLLHRTIALNREAADSEARTVPLSFSSEEPVERWWGREILDHAAKSVRLGRLTQRGPLLMDHNPQDQIGVVEDVEITKDRKGRAVVRFGQSARATEIWQDVMDGIRGNVSVGYMIHRMVLEEEKEGQETYRALDWEPLEVSLVSIPADITVGVGRGREESKHITIIETPTAESKEENRAMPEIETETKVETRETPVVDHGKSVDAEKRRVREILALASQHNAAELGRQFIDGDKSVEEFACTLLERQGAKPVDTTPAIGLSQKEQQRYSFMRALNALANPGDRKIQEAAAFERECSDAAAEKLKRSAQGLFVPFDVMVRDLVVGTDSAGGYLVGTDHLAGSFIELLRNRMMVRKMGARLLDGLVGDVAIPKLAGGATAYWVAESGAPTESQQTIGQVTLAPKTVGAFTDISRKLLKQSTPAADMLVQEDLATVLGLAIDLAALHGSGTSNQPTGIAATSGIGAVVGGTDGAAPDWADVVGLWQEVAIDNADIGSLGFLTNPKVVGKLMTTEKATNTAQFVCPGFPNAEGLTTLGGMRCGVSSQVASNLDKGTSTGVCSAIFFGNWADLIIGAWGGLDLTVDPYSGSTSGTVRVVALQDVDIAVRHAESFAAMLDALTT